MTPQPGYPPPAMQPQSMPTPTTSSTTSGGGGLFGGLAGSLGHVLVLLGLLLSFFGVAQAQFRATGASAANAELKRASELIDMDMRAAEEDAKESKDDSFKPSEKREELEKKYKLKELRRDAVEASAGASGLRLHYILDAAGRVLMIVALLALAAYSEGARQKAYIVALAIVLLASLSGVGLRVEVHPLSAKVSS
ncbi:MAG: hypothetical protein HYV09_13990 [Deltaproteobacteria bacterium]|nr:hypothetical protein [Deltaproteobacteria bacterium]